jgi:hypothetical protein
MQNFRHGWLSLKRQSICLFQLMLQLLLLERFIVHSTELGRKKVHECNLFSATCGVQSCLRYVSRLAFTL